MLLSMHSQSFQSVEFLSKQYMWTLPKIIDFFVWRFCFPYIIMLNLIYCSDRHQRTSIQPKQRMIPEIPWLPRKTAKSLHDRKRRAEPSRSICWLVVHAFSTSATTYQLTLLKFTHLVIYSFTWSTYISFCLPLYRSKLMHDRCSNSDSNSNSKRRMVIGIRIMSTSNPELLHPCPFRLQTLYPLLYMTRDFEGLPILPPNIAALSCLPIDVLPRTHSIRLCMCFYFLRDFFFIVRISSLFRYFRKRYVYINSLRFDLFSCLHRHIMLYYLCFGIRTNTGNDKWSKCCYMRTYGLRHHTKSCKQIGFDFHFYR